MTGYSMIAFFGAIILGSMTDDSFFSFLTNLCSMTDDRFFSLQPTYEQFMLDDSLTATIG